ncbi:hypothetical protein BDW59DRAFT_179037 [Aspergillus cavernicola]|uniref:Uncharacterized protein n=1 Tax=Aspergillus cavernicola TaxID=176166 RepID=A0ABR4IJ52_9EURO
MEHDPKDVEAFYEIICFSRSLSVVRGNRIKPRWSAESDGVDLAKCRRDFADAIAYFCAYSCSPDCVTAVALGKRNTKVVLWVASNAKVQAKVINFLKDDVLNVLKELACASIAQGCLPSNKQELERRLASLLDKILQFTREKNFKYYKSALTIWREICRSTKGEGLDNTNPDLIAVREWFEWTFKKTGVMLERRDMPGLAKNCYDARTTSTFSILRHCSSQSNEQRLDYERLHKLLYKLGKHVALFQKMIQATFSLRNVFQGGFAVEPIPASTPKHIPFPEHHSWSMEKIAARVFPERDKRNQFFHHLNQFYDKTEIYQYLDSFKEKGQIRVHAEILLIDHFDKVGGDFLDNNDKYIGCSKPACYLCYHYICQHPGNYTRPPSHQKLYHAWCLPSIRAHDPNFTDKFDRHKRFLDHVTEDLRSSLRKEVLQQLGPRKYHADSTAGASSVVDITRARSKGVDDSIRALMRMLSEG